MPQFVGPTEAQYGQANIGYLNQSLGGLANALAQRREFNANEFYKNYALLDAYRTAQGYGWKQLAEENPGVIKNMLGAYVPEGDLNSLIANIASGDETVAQSVDRSFKDFVKGFNTVEKQVPPQAPAVANAPAPASGMLPIDVHNNVPSPSPPPPAPPAPITATPNVPQTGQTTSAPVGVVPLTLVKPQPLAPNGGLPQGVPSVSLPRGSFTWKDKIRQGNLLLGNFTMKQYEAALNGFISENYTPDQLDALAQKYMETDYASAEAALDAADFLRTGEISRRAGMSGVGEAMRKKLKEPKAPPNPAKRPWGQGPSGGAGAGEFSGAASGLPGPSGGSAPAGAGGPSGATTGADVGATTATPDMQALLAQIAANASTPSPMSERATTMAMTRAKDILVTEGRKMGAEMTKDPAFKTASRYRAYANNLSNVLSNIDPEARAVDNPFLRKLMNYDQALNDAQLMNEIRKADAEIALGPAKLLAAKKQADADYLKATVDLVKDNTDWGKALLNNFQELNKVYFGPDWQKKSVEDKAREITKLSETDSRYNAALQAYLHAFEKDERVKVIMENMSTYERVLFLGVPSETVGLGITYGQASTGAAIGKEQILSNNRELIDRWK